MKYPPTRARPFRVLARQALQKTISRRSVLAASALGVAVSIPFFTFGAFPNDNEKPLKLYMTQSGEVALLYDMKTIKKHRWTRLITFDQRGEIISKIENPTQKSDRNYLVIGIFDPSKSITGIKVMGYSASGGYQTQNVSINFGRKKPRYRTRNY
ncbi:MAG: hypothetical protein AAF352_02085 [Pseudomonadota bacterium]